MKKQKSLRRRWFVNTVGVVCALGLLLVVVVTALFAGSYYSNMVSDMQYRAKTTTDFFSEFLNRDYQEFYETCVLYTHSYDDHHNIELQFINAQGQLVASSTGEISGVNPSTREIQEAMDTRDVRPFIGKDPVTEAWIVAVSSPIIYGSGEVIGVLRYVTPAALINHQVAVIGMCALLVLAVVCVVVVISSNYYIRSILVPLAEITEKAKKIAGGTYGIQISTKYDDEIGELAKTVNEMSAQIARNEKMQTEFISSLSHELRTPLTVITGWSETLIDDENMDPDTLRGMKIIQSEAKRLTEMVVDLLDFTRIQDGRMTLNVGPTDIRSEFEDTVFMYSSRLAQDGITLDYLENDEEIPEIICDGQRLRQVFLNILDNAAKHGGDGKRIEASMAFEDGVVVVRIRDFGPGIPEDEIPLVKKKFYKGSSKARGNGIGLAVCDEIVQMHGGDLILENAQGGGTVVTVQLPATQ